MYLQGRNLFLKMQGNDVKGLQECLRKLNYDIPKEESRQGMFGEGTKNAVAELQRKSGIQTGGIVDERTVKIINELIGEAPQNRESENMGMLYTVKGKVRNNKGGAVAGCMIQLYDRGLRNEVLINVALADGEGQFDVSYIRGTIDPSVRKAIHLVVKAMTSEGNLLAESLVIYGPNSVEYIELIAENELTALTRYQKLMDSVQPLLEGIDISELKEDEINKDITYISEKTGNSYQDIELLVKSARLEKSTGLNREVLYGLQLQNISLVPELLFTTKQNHILKVLDNAVNRNLVSKTIAENKDEISEKLDRIRREHDLKLNEGISKDNIKDTKYVMELNEIAGDYALTKGIQSLSKTKKISNAKHLTKLNASDWEDVISGLKDKGEMNEFPSWVEGSDDQQRISNYARAMVSKTEDKFPKEAVYYGMRKADNLDGDLGELYEKLMGTRISFDLKNVHIDSFLERRSVKRILKNIPEERRMQLAGKLLKMQRIRKTTANYEEMDILLKEGFDSAHKITRLGKKRFVETYKNKLQGKEVAARQIYENAMQISAAALNLYTSNCPSINNVKMSAIAPNAPVADIESMFGSFDLCDCEHCRSVLSPAAYYVDILHFLKDRRSEIDGLYAKDILFQRRPDLGEIELTCENTNTTLPYLDLVNEVLENTISPMKFDLLNHLKNELNSGKISTTLRHEFRNNRFILSDSAVVSKSGNEDKWSIRDKGWQYRAEFSAGKLEVSVYPQTSISSTEMNAGPEHMNSKAFGKLAGQVYPWNLPFDPWLEQVRVYLGHLGVPRHELMLTFLDSAQRSTFPAKAIACDYLGLTSTAWNIIVGNSLEPEHMPWEYWGYKTETLRVEYLKKDDTWVNDLALVKTLLKKAGLKYQELTELLETRFINPLGEIIIESVDKDDLETCDTSKLVLKNITDFEFDRMHRFIRLWKVIGWKVQELDKAIFTVKSIRCSYKNLGDKLLACNNAINPIINKPLSNNTNQGINKSFIAKISEIKNVIDQVDTRKRYPKFDSKSEADLEQLLVEADKEIGMMKDDGTFTGNDNNTLEDLKDKLEEIIEAMKGIYKYTEIDDNLLIVLSYIKKLKSRFRLPVTVILAWLGPIDTASLYSQLFSTQSVSGVDNHEEDPFKLNTTFTELASTDKLLDDEKIKSRLMSVLGITETEISLLIQGNTGLEKQGSLPEVNAVVINKKLNLENLSRLYRHTVFSKKMKISILDLLRLKCITGIEPFVNNGFGVDFSYTKIMLQFIEIADKTRSSGFSINELDYLLRHQTVLGSNLIPAVETIEVLLEEIRAGLQKIADETKLLPDQTGELTRKRLAAMKWDEGIIEEIISIFNSNKSCDTGLNSLPQGYFFPDVLKDKIVYAEEVKKLRFVGVMTPEEKQQLLNSSNNQSFITAVEELYTMPRRFIQNYMKVYEMPLFSTALDNIPIDVVLPDEIKNRVYFDVSASKLCCCGPMTEVDKTTLLDLPKDKNTIESTKYISAVEKLFHDSITFVPITENVFLTAADVSELFDKSLCPTEKFEYILKKLLPYLKATTSKKMIVQKIGNVLQMEANISEKLLVKWVMSPLDVRKHAIDVLLETSFAQSDLRSKVLETVYPEQFAVFIRLQKISLIVKKLKLKQIHDGWIFDKTCLPPQQRAIWFDINLLPFKAIAESGFLLNTWCKFIDLMGLRNKIQGGEVLLDSIYGENSILNLTENDFYAKLSENTGWNLNDIKSLAGINGLGIKYPDAFKDEAPLKTLRDCLDISNRLGVSASMCSMWTKAYESDTDVITMEDALCAQQAVKAKYAEEQWLEIIKPMADMLREKQRDALVSYLVNNPDQSRGQYWKNIEELYEHLLIDVEMNSAMVTSRIKQAINSVQMFAQRCIMGLEQPNVKVDIDLDDKWKEWKWSKNYRVWEANRKVFIYPENWIEPELRDDKSPFFKEMESELLQNDINDDNVETAMVHYVEKLDKVSQLEICNTCTEIIKDDYGYYSKSILHVIGRTPGSPHQYYHRKRVNNLYWTPWEKIDLDIQGDLLHPVVWNRRLYLMWPVFTSKSYEPTQVEKRRGDDPKLKWEVQIAWSRYNKGVWSPKTISKEFLEFPKTDEKLYSTKIVYDATDIEKKGLYIFVNNKNFLFSRGRDEAVKGDGYPKYVSRSARIKPNGAEMNFNAYSPKADAGNALSIWDNNYIYRHLTLMNKVGANYKIHPIQNRAAFFYADSERTFMAETVSTGNAVSVSNTGSLSINYDLPYGFKSFYHPFVWLFIQELNRLGIEGLFRRDLQTKPHSYLANKKPFCFYKVYEPDTTDVYGDYPKEDIDFSEDGSYSQYNWELFFHAPLMIADKLSKNQRFEEAQKWFHFIFNPMDISKNPVPARYWQTKPFFDPSDPEYQKMQMKDLLKILAKYSARESLSNQEYKLIEKLHIQVSRWRDNPFNPHLIARMRTSAFQKAVVMKYLDNLISWGDQLFRRDTIESINEATQLYILAACILGPKPSIIKPRFQPEVQTFNSLQSKLGRDDFSDPMVKAENLVTLGGFNGSTPPSQNQQTLVMPSLLYFAIPNNEKLLGYWDTVADRLFKIRNCLNIEGIARQLQLFEPPIDPAMLVQAAAAGIDISSALNDMNAALPNYRFSVILQKAAELCSEVKSLGAALLSALEKKDAEALALLKAGQEKEILDLITAMKKKQIEEAKISYDGLQKSKDVVNARYSYYSSLSFMNTWETVGLVLSGVALVSQVAATILEAAAGGSHCIPDFTVGGAGFAGSPVATVTTGGGSAGNAAQSFARALQNTASCLNSGASMSNTMGSYKRREEEWQYQADLALKEMDQIQKQIEAADIRKKIAETDLDNHLKQVDNAVETEEYMKSKFTDTELYSWVVGQISGVYFQAYQMAYDIAKRAECAYHYEIGSDTTSYINFGYWDSLKKGLLSGERMYHDIKRMEMAYFDKNKREYEITKHISLAITDPVALIKLKENGECFINIPEEAFDIDYPGLYFRRIKTVSLTIPCVTGPYTSINCKLTLLRNSVRKTATPAILEDEYTRRKDGDDPRFDDNVGAIQSIVTSSAQYDSGLFELSLRDERYLPFEGAGAISLWRVQMDKDCNHFDFNTIADVILHLKYTAREGGDILKNAAKASAVSATLSSGVRIFNAKSDYSTNWHKFLYPFGQNDEQKMDIDLEKDRFPYLYRNKDLQINKIEFYFKFKENVYHKILNDETYSTNLPLKLNLELTLTNKNPETPSTQVSPVLLISDPTLNGILKGVVDMSRNPVIIDEWNWNIKRRDTSSLPELLKDETNGRLIPGTVDNLALACFYSTGEE